jgi:hypothetical protein
VEWSWRAGQKMHEDDPGLVSIEQDGGDGASGGGGKKLERRSCLPPRLLLPLPLQNSRFSLSDQALVGQGSLNVSGSHLGHMCDL